MEFTYNDKRCGKCAACLTVEKVKRQSLTALSHAYHQSVAMPIGEDIRLIWNRALEENPCQKQEAPTEAHV